MLLKAVIVPNVWQTEKKPGRSEAEKGSFFSSSGEKIGRDLQFLPSFGLLVRLSPLLSLLSQQPLQTFGRILLCLLFILPPPSLPHSIHPSGVVQSGARGERKRKWDGR